MQQKLILEITISKWSSITRTLRGRLGNQCCCNGDLKISLLSCTKTVGTSDEVSYAIGVNHYKDQLIMGQIVMETSQPEFPNCNNVILIAMSIFPKKWKITMQLSIESWWGRISKQWHSVHRFMKLQHRVNILDHICSNSTSQTQKCFSN